MVENVLPWDVAARVGQVLELKFLGLTLTVSILAWKVADRVSERLGVKLDLLGFIVAVNVLTWGVAARVGKVLEFLGLTVAVLLEDEEHLRAREPLQADVVYVKASKLCFTYISDNISATEPYQYVCLACGRLCYDGWLSYLVQCYQPVPAVWPGSADVFLGVPHAEHSVEVNKDRCYRR